MSQGSAQAGRGMPEEGWLSRERALALALMVATGLVFYLCYRLALPFLPALAWGLALAVMAYPMHRKVQRVFPSPNVAAGLSVVMVSVVIVVPVIFVTNNLVREVERFVATFQEQFSSGRWRAIFEENPRLKPILPWVESQLGTNGGEPKPAGEVKNGRPTKNAGPSDENGPVDERDASKPENGSHEQRSSDEQIEGEEQNSSDNAASTDASKASAPAKTSATDQSSREGAPVDESRSGDRRDESPLVEPAPVKPPQPSAPVKQAAGMLTRGVGSVMTGTVWFVMQLFITLLALFFFFRDQRGALGVLRSLMPLSDAEIDEVFKRVDDTIHATLYGSLAVALVQGTMGGLMFWWLGLPAPLMWGAVMSLLAVVPVLGTFVVWGPTAIYLALQGDWTRALLLATWGAVAIGLVDNVLYPFLVGQRLRFHTLLVFMAIVGGLWLFGASGVILGPLLLAMADALLEVWRRRTAFGGTIEGGVEPTS